MRPSEIQRNKEKPSETTRDQVKPSEETETEWDLSETQGDQVDESVQNKSQADASIARAVEGSSGVLANEAASNAESVVPAKDDSSAAKNPLLAQLDASDDSDEEERGAPVDEPNKKEKKVGNEQMVDSQVRHIRCGANDDEASANVPKKKQKKKKKKKNKKGIG